MKVKAKSLRWLVWACDVRMPTSAHVPMLNAKATEARLPQMLRGCFQCTRDLVEVRVWCPPPDSRAEGVAQLEHRRTHRRFAVAPVVVYGLCALCAANPRTERDIEAQWPRLPEPITPGELTSLLQETV